ncbi:MAG: phosphate ABC transporter permease subunit PstC [Spirochaetaceae bacterium]|jgi:phosphate transport system permease protein|nr:phosphate ABC transporter permease subunit PstC [Spirochaetaceae bacterium]
MNSGWPGGYLISDYNNSTLENKKKKIVKRRERVAAYLFFISAAVSVLAVLLICAFLFASGAPVFGKIGIFNFLFGKEWSPVDSPASFGILPMIAGSLYVTSVALAAGLPVGILTAIFLAFCCPQKIYKILKPAVDLLAGIPSVVYGFFGMMAIVPLTGNSIFSAGILLGIMILPVVAGISESALRAVPREYYEGALALGAGHYRSIFYVLLPAAKSGVLAAAVLGLGRAVGETMAVIMVAGNQARLPVSLFKGARTLTSNIVLEMGYAAGLHREALIGTGVVLFVFVLIVNISFSVIKRKRL